jgi:hypothetical protein
VSLPHRRKTNLLAIEYVSGESTGWKPFGMGNLIFKTIPHLPDINVKMVFSQVWHVAYADEFDLNFVFL